MLSIAIYRTARAAGCSTQGLAVATGLGIVTGLAMVYGIVRLLDWWLF